MAIAHIYRKWQADNAMYYSWFSAMHTRIDIILTGQHSEQAFSDTVENIHKQLVHIENVGNCFDPQSELSMFNNSPAHHKMAVSADLAEMLEKCNAYKLATNGMFDVTVESGKGNFSTQFDDKVQQHYATRHSDDLRINLSGFLKGYALENIRNIIKESEIGNALINFGNSSVMAIGNQPNHSGWDIDFIESSHPINLLNQCLSVSGNDSSSRAHIYNPHSGKPVTGKRQLAVVCDSATDAEILTTALFASQDECCEWLKNFKTNRIINI